jgi:hypothetical protein
MEVDKSFILNLMSNIFVAQKHTSFAESCPGFFFISVRFYSFRDLGGTEIFPLGAEFVCLPLTLLCLWA